MAVGLLLEQGGNIGERQDSTGHAESVSVGPEERSPTSLDDRIGRERHMVVDNADASSPVAALAPTPFPPAEALPYVSKEFDLCIHPWECEIVSRVQACENRAGDPWRVSSTGDYGIMQINRFTWEWWLNERGFNFEIQWMLPESNIAMAYTIWQNSWWWPWNCF